jgi:hypothetical protein
MRPIELGTASAKNRSGGTWETPYREEELAGFELLSRAGGIAMLQKISQQDAVVGSVGDLCRATL